LLSLSYHLENTIELAARVVLEQGMSLAGYLFRQASRQKQSA